MFFKFIRKSLKLKLVLASILVEIVMLTILLGNSLRIINASIDQQILIKKDSISPLLDSALSIPLFERDLATLNVLMRKLTLNDNSEFIYITVYDQNGKIFSEITKKTQREGNKELAENHIIHISTPLTIADTEIGSVKYGLSNRLLYDAKQTLFYQGLLIAFFEIILTIILLGLTSYYLTRHLTILLSCAEEISSGNYNVDIPVHTPDEIGLLAHEFNIMANAIQNRISEISETSNSLKIKTAEFKSIFNSIDDGVIFIDKKGLCVSANSSILNMFGYSLNHFLNKKIDFLYANKDAHDKQWALHFIENASDKNKIIEESFQRKDSSTFIGEILVSRVYDETDKLLGFVSILRDITERKIQEAQSQRKYKIELMAQLTGGIAHDYNNMLAIILGYSRLLEDSLSDQPKLNEYIKEITHAAERGSKLTKKLLSLSRIKASNKDNVIINTVLLGEQNMLEKTLTARIQLDFNLQEDIWHISVDIDDLIDAIINICINAMHAIDGSGKLTFTTSNQHFENSDTHLFQLDKNDYVVLSITDTGCGMTDDEKNKIFEPFYSTKGEMGTGLGLSQVYGFIQRSNGSIKVYSEPGHGTQITMYFPRWHVDTEGKDKPVLPDLDIEHQLQGSQSILIVDDEPSLLKLSSETIGCKGYRVFCAENGLQALEILKNESIDLMISDVIMPEMDGYELSLLVQEKYPKIKIQLVSGFNDNRHEKMTNNDLYKNLISKPFDSITLLKRIRELLG